MQKFRYLAIALVLAFALPACGGPAEYAMTGTARSAGTDGIVTVDEIEGGSLLATVRLEHLPPAERMGDGLTTYIVWFEEEGSSPIKAGILDYDEDERTGVMRATTPSQNQITVIVTAEEDRDANSPSEIVIARRVLQ